jgi:hypothetical protein
MTSTAPWLENNERYLEAALVWLRLRLARLADASQPAMPAPRGCLWPRRTPASFSAPHIAGSKIKQAAMAMDKAADVDPQPALILLAQRLGLSDFERDILLLCAAMEFDAQVASLSAEAQHDSSRPYPTFSLALRLFDDPAWDSLTPERPLRYWRLLEISQPGALALNYSPLRADERIVNFIKGLNNTPDDRLSSLLTALEEPLPGGEADLLPSQLGVVSRIVHVLNTSDHREPPPIVELLGQDSSGKRLAARVAAAHLGLELYYLPSERLPTAPGEFDRFLRLWQRETLLLPVALYLDAHQVDPALNDGLAASIGRFLAECSGVLFVDARDIWPTVSHTTALIEVPRPGYSEQVIAWTSLIGDLSPGSPAALANQFNLNLPDIRQIAQPAMAGTNHSPADLHRQLWDACLIRSRAQLDKLAQRIEPKATWDDLVLPDDEKNLLRQITSQVRQRSIVIEEWGFDQQTSRGLGLSILFAGESGTGKTMAAEVMANELQLNLYRIDLSSVVDKYIGETEKRLRQLFDEAENGGVILFFDEADALFGKRSEVKDSHDRYANIEINYLLQRMESFSRLAILASNMKSLLDNAFLRRLRFIVNFPYPGPAERKLIWQRVFPRETPLGDLDYNWLARLNLTGGNIHTVALNAAFLAANQPPGHQQVTMPLVLEAARNEFRKLDKPMNEADFHWEPNGQVRV